MIANRQAYQEQGISIKNRQIEQVTYHKTIVCFFIIFFICSAFCIFFFIEISNVTEVSHQYYQSGQAGTCKIGAVCTVSFTITSQMQQPIYFMYQLGNFYQNHRRYIQSKSNYQLAGNDIDENQASSCHPYRTNADMKVNVSWGNVTLNPNAIASPCGSIAFTFFNDTFKLIYNSSIIPIDETGIAWDGDKGGRFKRSYNSSAVQWIDPENEHFIVWMRTSGLPNFKKLWGKIYQNLQPGQYSVQISNNYNSKDWDGDRYFYLTTLSLIGGKNFLIPITFCVITVLDLVAVIFFCRRFRALKNISKIKS